MANGTAFQTRAAGIHNALPPTIRCCKNISKAHAKLKSQCTALQSIRTEMFSVSV